MRKRTTPTFSRNELNLTKKSAYEYNECKANDIKSLTHYNQSDNIHQTQIFNRRRYCKDLFHSKYERPFSKFNQKENSLYHKVKYYDTIILCHKPKIKNSIILSQQILQCPKYSMEEICVNRNVRDYLEPNQSTFHFSYPLFIKQALKPSVAPRRQVIIQQQQQHMPEEKEIKEVKTEKSYCDDSSNSDSLINCGIVDNIGYNVPKIKSNDNQMFSNGI